MNKYNQTKNGEKQAYAVEVRVYQGDVVIARNDVSEGRELLFDALHDDLVRQGVADVHQFLIGGGIGEEEALAIARRQATDNARASHGAVNDGDMISQLVLKHFVKFAAANGAQAISICELAEHADVAVLLELRTDRHLNEKQGDESATNTEGRC